MDIRVCSPFCPSVPCSCAFITFPESCLPAMHLANCATHNTLQYSAMCVRFPVSSLNAAYEKKRREEEAARKRHEEEAAKKRREAEEAAKRRREEAAKQRAQAATNARLAAEKKAKEEAAKKLLASKKAGTGKQAATGKKKGQDQTKGKQQGKGKGKQETAGAAKAPPSLSAAQKSNSKCSMIFVTRGLALNLICVHWHGIACTCVCGLVHLINLYLQMRSVTLNSSSKNVLPIPMHSNPSYPSGCYSGTSLYQAPSWSMTSCSIVLQ